MKEIIERAEINYKIKERVELLLSNKKTTKIALIHLNNELNNYNNIWSDYSCDCLGNAITCVKLMINYINETYERNN